MYLQHSSKNDSLAARDDNRRHYRVIPPFSPIKSWSAPASAYPKNNNIFYINILKLDTVGDTVMSGVRIQLVLIFFGGGGHDKKNLIIKIFFWKLQFFDETLSCPEK